MEETIGYEALFSPLEWNAIASNDYSEIDLQAHDEFEGGEHETSICAGRGSIDHLYDVWCRSCDYVAPADTLEQAQAIARLHEAFVATLADEWDIDREREDGSFKVTCPQCGEVGSADDAGTADLLQRLHTRAETLATQAKGAAS